MDDTLNRFKQCRIDNILNDKETYHTDSTLYWYIYMPIVNTIYGYQESELNHMVGPGGQRDQEYGVVLHDQEEGYQPPINFRT